MSPTTIVYLVYSEMPPTKIVYLGYSEMPPTAFIFFGNFLNNSSSGTVYNNSLKVGQ